MKIYQNRVHLWMHKCFNPEIINSQVERNNRFIEESIELVQSLGMTKEELLKIVDYVYSREQGDVNQEVGGVMVTLAALCNNQFISIKKAAKDELLRIDTPGMIESIREKQRIKERQKVAIPTNSDW